MSLELLANELLFDIFQYLSSVDLFHSFNGLNIRFDSLLIDYFQIHKSIDFRLIFKEDLNLFRRRYLPLFINEIKSICLSDNDTNPHEIDLFISRIFPLHRFINLQSISFYNIYSIEKMIRILNDLQQISNLTELNFYQCHLEYDLKNVIIIMNQIWSFSNLIYCSLDISFENNCYLIIPTIISTSIQYLSIQGVRCGLDNLQFLYEHTPYLKNLSIDIAEALYDHQPLSLIHGLTTLKLKCETSSTLIQSLLRKVPNLINLTIEIKNIININGSMWENVLSKYLAKLKIFNLKMQFELQDIDDIEQEIDNIINSYRTQFWIDEHKWFVQCFCYTKNEINMIHLHTLPYRFQYLLIDINQNENFILKSTCPNDDHYLTYNHVQNLNCSCYISEHINFPKIQFPNVKNLTLTIPYDDHFRFLVPRFDNLISLGIQMITWEDYNNELRQLQLLIDQAPRLYYLKFHSWPSKVENKNQNQRRSKTTVSEMPPFSIRSSSIRYLDLRGYDQSGHCQYYNDQQCSSLIRSSLGIQCEFLLIDVEKPTNIIDLVNKMKYLRTINVRCCDRKKNNHDLIKNRLPTTCTIAKDSRYSEDIRLWIR